MDSPCNLEDIRKEKGGGFIHLNTHGIVKHFKEINTQFLDGNFEVVVITESQLHYNVGDGLIHSNHYNLTRLDRQICGPSGR